MKTLHPVGPDGRVSMLLEKRFLISSFRHAEILNLGAAGVPPVLSEFDAPDGAFSILGTHPLPLAGGICP